MTTNERRALGCVLGAAIGDAMGHPTEFLDLAAIRARWGPQGVQGFALWWTTKDGRRFAPYTDDTQMAEAVLRTLVDGHDDLDDTMTRMADAFVAWAQDPQGGHRAPGNACLAGCRALAEGTHWSEAGGPRAGGCGSVMRAYPFGLVFVDDVARAEAWSVAHSKLTHRDPIALAACAAMAVGVASCARGTPVDDALAAMIDAAGRHDAVTRDLIARAVDEARRGVDADVVMDRLRSWAAHEAIAAGAFLLARFPDDARGAILAGANTPGDSDSIATIGGALVGARVGVDGLDGLPAEWVRDVERADELTALARRVA
jgi:ADP-ribosylglycohydrolase